jgi:hypothetical protein
MVAKRIAAAGGGFCLRSHLRIILARIILVKTVARLKVRAREKIRLSRVILTRRAGPSPRGRTRLSSHMGGGAPFYASRGLC